MNRKWLYSLYSLVEKLPFVNTEPEEDKKWDAYYIPEDETNQWDESIDSQENDGYVDYDIDD